MSVAHGVDVQYDQQTGSKDWAFTTVGDGGSPAGGDPVGGGNLDGGSLDGGGDTGGLAPAVTIPTPTARASKKGVLGIKLSCLNAACAGKLTLRATYKAGGTKHSVTLGTKPFSIAAGKTATVKLTLSRATQKLLKRTKKLTVKGTVTLNGRSGT